MCNHEFTCEIGDCECGGDYFKCETCGDEYRCAYCGICNGECRRKEEGEPDIYRIIIEIYNDENKEDFEIVSEIEYSSNDGLNKIMNQYKIQCEKWKNYKNFKCVSLICYEFGGEDGDVVEDYWYEDAEEEEGYAVSEHPPKFVENCPEPS